MPDSSLSARQSSEHAETSAPTTPTRMHRPAAHTELKGCNILCPELMQHRASVIEVHAPQPLAKSSPLVTINVSGDRFQTHLSTLEAYPDTLLGDESKREPYWNADAQEYFFDRQRACFEAILYYYQSNGRLRRPESVPVDTFLEEITFFQLGAEVFSQVHQAENIKVVEPVQLPRMLWRRYIWFYLEFPLYSAVARWINVISLLLTVVSCISLAVETLPEFDCDERYNQSLNATMTTFCADLFNSPFFIIQTVCVAYFTVEFLLRLISTPSYRQFVLAFFNWIDLGAILPYFVLLAIEMTSYKSTLNTNVIDGIRLLRVLRFLRIFKIYLVLRRLKTLRVLSSTIKESLADFAMIILILTLVAFLFGAAAYFAEQATNGEVFDSIPKAVYWGIITISGVGYGEMYPITVIGRIVACLCALVGSGMMGMLVSILVDRYQRVYARKMYVPDCKTPPAELSSFINGEETPQTSVTAWITKQRRKGPSILNRLKPSRRRSSSQSHQIQLVVSFDGEQLNGGDTDQIVAAVRERVSEVLINKGADIHLEVIEDINEQFAPAEPLDSDSMGTKL